MIGYIGRINDRDVERIAEWDETANYKGSDYIGKVGVELVVRARAARHGRVGRGRGRRERSRGAHAVADAAGVRQQPAPVARHQVAASGGSGIRRSRAARWWRSNRHPATCSPSCRNPASTRTCFVDGIDPANWQDLNESPDKPLLESAATRRVSAWIDDQPFLALSALNSGSRTATQTIFRSRLLQIPGQAHRFRDDKPGGHGTVDMYKSIVVSCDTYYYILASETDIDDTARFMSQLGFGQKTGIDIEGELTGIAAIARMEAATFRRARIIATSIASGIWATLISAGIGQGYNAFTPIQLAHAIAMVANDGVG